MHNTDKRSAYYKLQRRREEAFRLLFKNVEDDLKPHAIDALAFLRDVCFATKTTFNPNIPDGMALALTMAKNEGRREVFNEVTNLLHVNYEEFYQLNEELDYD